MALKFPGNFEGNLAADPETKTSSRTNKSFVTFTLMVTERVRDAEGQYADGEATAIDVQVHAEELSKHVLASLKSGHRVSAEGTYSSRPYAKSDGELGTNHTLMANNVSASLRFNDLTINKRTPTAAASADISADAWADVEVANVQGTAATFS